MSPPVTDETLRELRQRYQTAYTAYRSCVDAMTALTLRSEKPSLELLDSEAKALRELNEARDAHRAALLEADRI